MATRTVGFQLRTDGKAEVKNDFAEVRKAGSDAMAGIAKAANDTAEATAAATERAEQRQLAAWKRQAAAAKLAAGGVAAGGAIDGALARTGSQQFATVNLDRTTGAARASAAAFEEMFRAEAQAAAATAQLESRTRAFLTALDPAYAAQDRFNNEIGEARTLVSAGTITLDQYCAKLREERAALDAATGGHGRAVVSTGQLKAGTQQLSYQIGDVAASFASGTPIIQIFGQQIGQTIQAVTLMKGESTGLIGFLAGPWGAVLTGAAIIAATLGSKLLEGGEAAKTKKSAIESLTEAQREYVNQTGRTAQAETVQVRLTEISTRALLTKEIATRNLIKAQLDQAAAQFKIDRTRAGAIGERGDMGALAAGETAAQVADLKARMADQDASIAKSRQTLLTAQVSRATLDATAATDKAAAATQRYDTVVFLLQKRFREGKISQEQLTAAMIRARQAQEAASGTGSGGSIAAAADQSARLATATNAVQRAEAQLAIVRREGAAAVKAGTLSQGDYEARLISARSAVNGAREAERDAAQARRDGAKAARDLLGDLKALEQAYDQAAARARAYAEQVDQIEALRKAGPKGGGIDADTAERYRRQAAIARFDAEEAAWTSAASTKFATMFPQLKSGDDLAKGSKADLDAIGVAAERATARMMALTPALADLQPVGDRLLDTIFSPDTWRSWGDAGKSAIRQIEAQLIKLAVVNPLKNLLFGGGNATLSSVFGSIAGAFTGKASITGGINNVSSALGFAPKNAAGTEWFSGGLTWVGENGPEIVSAPRGAQITPAGRARQMMSAANDTQRETKVTVVKGDLFDVIVERIATPIAAAAGQRAMIGGADMAIDRLARKRRQGL